MANPPHPSRQKSKPRQATTEPSSTGDSAAGTETPRFEFVVHGTIVAAEPGDFVRAFDVDFRSEQLLGESPIKDGTYGIRYSLAQFGRAEKGTADLRVAVCEKGGRELASSPVSFNAPPDASINVTVLRDPDDASEYSRYLLELAGVMQGVTLGDVASQPEAQRKKDIDFLAGDTGIDRQHIDWLVQAAALHARSRSPESHSLAAARYATVDQREDHVPAAAFYGWFREGLPTDWDALVAEPIATLRAALVAAVENGVIPASLGQDPDFVLDAMPNARRDEVRVLATRFGLSLDRATKDDRGREECIYARDVIPLSVRDLRVVSGEA